MVSLLRHRGATVLAAWLACAALPLAAAPAGLGVQLDPPRVSLGEALTVTVTRPSTAPGPGLASLDLRAWEQDFEIVERTRGGDAAGENLVLTLYPRRTGRLALPGLGRPVAVEVAPSAVHLRISAEPSPLVARQAATLTLEACDDEGLQWRRPVLAAQDGYSLRALGESEVQAERAGLRCTAHRWHWAVLPTAGGPLRIAPPTLQALKFGRPLRFAAPVFEAEAAPVPSWLPGEVAIGPVAFEGQAADAPDAAAASVGRPWAWRFVVSGNASAQALRRLVEDQLPEHPAWAHVAPQVREMPSPQATPRHEVVLYLQPRERGILALPALRLPWFDPASGALQHALLPGQQVVVSDPARARLLQGLALVALVAALLGSGLWTWRRQAWRWRRWRFARALARVRDHEALHRTVLAFDLAGTPTPAATLGEWQRRMAAQAHAPGLAKLVEMLERGRYGGGDAQPVAQLRAGIQDWLRSLASKPKP